MQRGRSATRLAWIGGILSVLALVFVLRKLVGHAGEINFAGIATIWFPLMCLTVLYGTASVFLAIAWQNVLQHFNLPIDLRSAIHIWGVSQLSKYVPGNLFHFVGRQALGLQAGLPMWPLAKSTGWEITLVATSASAFSVFVLPHRYLAVSLPLSLAVFILGIAVAWWAARRFFGRRIGQAMTWYLLFHLLSGLCFLLVMLLMAPGTMWTAGTATYIGAAYVVAWLIGFVTPGAPAGVGIREVVLFALLQPLFGEPEILSAVVLGRIVTTVGDLGLYLFALGLGSHHQLGPS